MGEPGRPQPAVVLTLPSGLRVRGRGVRLGAPQVPPDFGLYLLGRRPVVPWPSRFVRWPDFTLPLRWGDFADALGELRRRAASEDVEVACGGGNGRTGTALACLAVLDGLAASDAIAFVRMHYRSGAVETPWQSWFVARYARRTVGGGR